MAADFQQSNRRYTLCSSIGYHLSLAAKMPVFCTYFADIISTMRYKYDKVIFDNILMINRTRLWNLLSSGARVAESVKLSPAN